MLSNRNNTQSDNKTTNSLLRYIVSGMLLYTAASMPNIALAKNNKLKIDSVEYDNSDTVVVYYDKAQPVEVYYHNHTITIHSDKAIDYNFQKSNIVKSANLSRDKKTVTLTLNNEYASFDYVEGENLVAVSLASRAKNKKVPDVATTANTKAEKKRFSNYDDTSSEEVSMSAYDSLSEGEKISFSNFDNTTLDTSAKPDKPSKSTTLKTTENKKNSEPVVAKAAKEPLTTKTVVAATPTAKKEAMQQPKETDTVVASAESVAAVKQTENDKMTLKKIERVKKVIRPEPKTLAEDLSNSVATKNDNENTITTSSIPSISDAKDDMSKDAVVTFFKPDDKVASLLENAKEESEQISSIDDNMVLANANTAQNIVNQSQPLEEKLNPNDVTLPKVDADDTAEPATKNDSIKLKSTQLLEQKTTDTAEHASTDISHKQEKPTEAIAPSEPKPSEGTAVSSAQKQEQPTAGTPQPARREGVDTSQYPNLIPQYKAESNYTLITVDMNAEDKSVAVFRRGTYIWFAIEGYYNLDLRNITETTTLAATTYHTVFGVKMKEGYQPFVVKNGSKWLVYCANNYEALQKADSTVKVAAANEVKLIDKVGFKIHTPDQVQVIEYRDPVRMDNVTIGMYKDPMHIGNLYSTPGAEILPTGQGIVLVRIDDDLSIKWDKNLFVVRDSALSFKPSITPDISKPLVVSSKKEFKTFLPIFVANYDGSNFMFTRRDLLQAIIKAGDDEDAEYNAKFELAKFYFINNMYPEALGALDLVDDDNPVYLKRPEMVLLKIVTLSLLNRPKESNDLALDLVSHTHDAMMQEEILLWQRYNNFLMGNQVDSLNVFQTLGSFVSFYPEKLYWAVVFAEMEIAYRTNNISVINALFQKARLATALEDKNTMLYYQAAFFRKANQQDTALFNMKKILAFPQDPRNYTRTTLEMVKMETKLRNMTLADGARLLEEVRYLWRGDQIEFDVLLTKADLYHDDQQYVNAMRSYKYLLDSYPGNASSLYITSAISQMYNKVFDPKSGIINKMADFDAVSLFYEFRKFIPIGEAGDNIILTIARRMINLDLLKQAGDILKHQIEYRLKDKNKVITGDHLAVVYLHDHKPEKALYVLNETDLQNTNYHEHWVRTRLRSKALFDLGKFDEALQTLKNDNSNDANEIRGEIYFKTGQWAKFIQNSSDNILHHVTSGPVNDGDQCQDILRLAICYSMLKKTDKLNELSSKLRTNNEVLKSAMGVVSSANSKIDVANLDRQFDVNRLDKYFKQVTGSLFSI